jgi:DNA polymerase-3 subunit alpha
MAKQYVELHCHDVFSFLDGHGKVEKYAERAKELNMGAIAQTNHGNIHGWMDFYDSCKKHDLKPVFGLEAYQARKSRFDRDDDERAGPARNEWDQRGPYHITILAQNKVGYHNLIKLSSRAYTEGFYVKPRMDHELISEHAEGLIVMSGCLNGEVQQAILRNDLDYALYAAYSMQDIVGKENYFIEVHDHGIEEELAVREALVAIAKTIGARIVPVGDCHYVNKSDHDAHDAMLCVSTKAQIASEERFKFSGPEFYLKSYEEVAQKFDPEWIKNTLHVADMVDVQLEFGEYYFPQAQDIPEEISVDDHLESLMWEGLKERYEDPLPQEVVDRATHELGVVKRMGFQEYFLVVADIVQEAKRRGIAVGPGRGSGAACIISYALRITNLCPIEYDLLFERFLIEGRKTVPDFDIDFDDRYRDEMIEYCREKYGYDHVAHIVTFAQVKTASAIRDAARVLGYEYNVGDHIAKLVPDAVLGVTKTLDECLETEEMKKLYENDAVAKEVIDIAKGLEGVYRQPGIHAAGIVITRGPVTDYVPTMQKGVDKPLIIQWDGDSVERNGLLKIDFLGLRNLGVIDLCVKQVKERRDIDIDIDNVPLDNEEVFDCLRKGKTIGCFQIEGEGMRQMMMELQPEDIFDILALISLYRPGPMGSGMDKMYINRKHGREKVSYPHESLRQVLEKSRGIMLYQEDVLNVAKVGAGLDAADADDLRRVIGKKYMDKVAEFRKKFVDGAMSTNGMSERVANDIYSDIEFFAGYGFNKAHAAAYGIISYQTAWLKIHYPVEYMAALMSTVTDKKDRMNLYLSECKNMGINVLPPSVSESKYHFTVRDDETILFGLSAVEGVGEAQINHLKKEGIDYKTFFTFFRTAESGALNKKTLEQLINAGAFDDLVNTDKITQKSISRSQKVEILNRENSAIGIYLSGHPLEDIWPVVKDEVSHTCLEVIEDMIGKGSVKLIGLVTEYKELTTKRTGQKMCKFSIEDMTGKVGVVIFTKDFARISRNLELSNGQVVTVTGNMRRESENADINIMGRNVVPLDRTLVEGGSPVILKPEGTITPSQLARLSDIIDNNPGDSPVYIRLYDQEYEISFKFTGSMNPKAETILVEVLALANLENLVEA